MTETFESSPIVAAVRRRFREEFDPPLGEGSVVKGSDGVRKTITN